MDNMNFKFNFRSTKYNLPDLDCWAIEKLKVKEGDLDRAPDERTGDALEVGDGDDVAPGFKRPDATATFLQGPLDAVIQPVQFLFEP